MVVGCSGGEHGDAGACVSEGGEDGGGVCVSKRVLVGTGDEEVEVGCRSAAII